MIGVLGGDDCVPGTSDEYLEERDILLSLLSHNISNAFGFSMWGNVNTSFCCWGTGTSSTASFETDTISVQCDERREHLVWLVINFPNCGWCEFRVPDDFPKLSHLQHLGLNNLDGPFPRVLCEMTNLQGLLLAGQDRQLNGSIPSCISQLTGLGVLAIQHNLLTCDERLAAIPALNTLDISNNALTDISLMQGLLESPALSFLNLGGNAITSFINMSSATLQTLDLSRNSLRDIPSLQGTQLIFLQISHNPLQQELTWINLPPKLHQLRLAECGLQGDAGVILDRVMAVAPLTVIDLARNNLTTLTIGPNGVYPCGVDFRGNNIVFRGDASYFVSRSLPLVDYEGFSCNTSYWLKNTVSRLPYAVYFDPETFGRTQCVCADGSWGDGHTCMDCSAMGLVCFDNRRGGDGRVAEYGAGLYPEVSENGTLLGFLPCAYALLAEGPFTP